MESKYFIDENGIIYTIFSDWKTNFPTDKGSIITSENHVTLWLTDGQAKEVLHHLRFSGDNNTVYVMGPECDGESEVLGEYQLWTSLSELAKEIESASVAHTDQ